MNVDLGYSWLRKDDSLVRYRAHSGLWPSLKTCSSSVIEDLVDVCRRQSSTEQRAIVLYFYFDSTTKHCNLPSLFKSWICQILTQLPSNKVQWDNPSNVIGAKTTVDDLFFDFRRLLSYCDGTVYGIIDALNECEDLEELLDWLKVINETQNHVRFLCTSHYLADIEDFTRDMFGEAFAIPNEQLLYDISIYLEERLSSDTKLKKWDPSLRKEVCDSIIMNAKDGVYVLRSSSENTTLILTGSDGWIANWNLSGQRPTPRPLGLSSKDLHRAWTNSTFVSFQKFQQTMCKMSTIFCSGSCFLCSR